MYSAPPWSTTQGGRGSKQLYRVLLLHLNEVIPLNIHRFDRHSLPATPWKNGGGLTREIVCMPHGGGLDSFDWRVSIAHIASNGPFSTFPGVDRVITLLEGGGVRLFTPDGTIDHRLDQPLAPFAFAGEAAIESLLLDGACEDFNVMTRRDRCWADVQVLQDNVSHVTAGTGLLLALTGRWQLDAGASDQTTTLLPQQGLWWHDATTSWRLFSDQPGSTLLCVLIHPSTP